MVGSWRQSIVRKYVAVSIVAALVPLGVVSVLYERNQSDLVATITGERLERRLTVIAGRLSAFLDARFYELETLAEYPAISAFVTPPYVADASAEALVQFEADQPDLYGILFFDERHSMVRAVAGAAAAGPPYWGKPKLSLAGATRFSTEKGEVIGPIAPRDGRSGSILLARKLRSEKSALGTGRIAMHVRLASLTERMGAGDARGIVRPVLLGPGQIVYSNVGVPTSPPANVVEGPEILPGWRPALAVQRERLDAPLHRARTALVIGLGLTTAVLLGLFASLATRIGYRVSNVVAGARALSSGDLSWRLESAGSDEIAALAGAFNAMAQRLQEVIRSSVQHEKMALLGRFATEVAHEVRNPLAAMKTTVQALIGTEKIEQRRRLLLGMDEEVDRLERALSDLLRFGRSRPARITDVDVVAVCGHVVSVVQKRADESAVKITQSGEAFTVRADEGHLQQILMNLVVNALQSMPHGGELALRALREGDAGVLEVRDTGSGMSPEVLSSLTDAFFTTRPGGTGLGLAISGHLAAMSGGRLSFSSEPGCGTCARLIVPLAGGAAQ